MNYRVYGSSPFSIVLVHGGPGATGELAPVARKIASDSAGVIEPFQTADTINGQISELSAIINEHCDTPVVLVGHSWGAWLSCLVAASHTNIVWKLIIIGSGPFEESYAQHIHETRMNRLSGNDRSEMIRLIKILHKKSENISPDNFKRFGMLMTCADTYNPLPPEPTDDEVVFRPDIYKKVWNSAAQLRKSGELLEHTAHITCPVVAIHGDYDPHPADGVRIPLGRVLADFRFILLEHCGHYPWRERQACDRFYTVLADELSC